MIYRLGTSYPRPWFGYAYPGPKRRPYVRRLSGPSTYEHTISQSVTASQTIVNSRWHFVTITHNVSAFQDISKVGLTYEKSVSHDVTAVQTIRSNRVLHFTVVHNVTASFTLTPLSTFITHNVVATHEIKLLRVLNMRISHDVKATDNVFVNSPRVLTVTHNVVAQDVFQGRLATFRKSIVDNVHATDYVYGRPATFHLTVTDNVTVGQYVRVFGAVTNISMSDSVTVTQRVNTSYLHRIEHDVNIYQTIGRQRITTHTITTAETLTSSFTRDLTFTLTTNLDVTSQFTRNLTVGRTLEESLNLISSLTPVLYISGVGQSPDGIYTPGTPHPVASGIQIVYSNLTILESIYGTIILPVPELNDSIRQNDSVEIKRSMTGVLSGYVKKSLTQILSYSWILDFNKAQELRAWALTNLTKDITLTNWKGEIWKVKIISNDLTLQGEGFYAGNARQKTAVTLEFEGVKLYG